MASAFGKILLITGATSAAEFLGERTRQRAEKQIVAERPEAEIAHARGADLVAGELAGLTSPSLFSDSSALVLTDLQDLGEDPAAELVAYAGNPSDDIAVVLVHGGGTKGKGVLDKLRKQSAVSEVKLSVPKYERDIITWVRDEARDHGRSMDDGAAALLTAAIGSDLRALAAAVDQLASTMDPGRPIDVDTISLYFGGRAEVKGYEIADAAVGGQLSVALEKSRWGAAHRLAPVLVIAAVAGALRQIALLATAPPGLREGELAAHVGVPPFKLRTLRSQVGAWSAAGLATALEAVAEADLAVKGGGGDPAYALERMLITVSASRTRR